MWAAGYKNCSICGLLNGMRAVVWYVGCCMVCGLFYAMWAAGYKSCSICGLLNGMWALVVYVGYCMECGLLDIRSVVYVSC